MTLREKLNQQISEAEQAIVALRNELAQLEAGAGSLIDRTEEELKAAFAYLKDKLGL